MPTIIEDNETKERYLVLGAGFDYADPEMLARVLDLDIEEVPVLNTAIAACDATGKIEWFDPEEVTVVEIDGKSPASLLAG